MLGSCNTLASQFLRENSSWISPRSIGLDVSRGELLAVAGGVGEMLQRGRMETGEPDLQPRLCWARLSSPACALCPPARLSPHWQGAGSTRHVPGCFPDPWSTAGVGASSPEQVPATLACQKPPSSTERPQCWVCRQPGCATIASTRDADGDSTAHCSHSLLVRKMENSPPVEWGIQGAIGADLPRRNRVTADDTTFPGLERDGL